jgi:transposase
MDLRKRVITACDEAKAIVQVSKQFNMSTSFVEKLQQRRRENGTLEPPTVADANPGYFP